VILEGGNATSDELVEVEVGERRLMTDAARRSRLEPLQKPSACTNDELDEGCVVGMLGLTSLLWSL